MLPPVFLLHANAALIRGRIGFKLRATTMTISVNLWLTKSGDLAVVSPFLSFAITVSVHITDAGSVSYGERCRRSALWHSLCL